MYRSCFAGLLALALCGPAAAQVQKRPEISVPLPEGRMILVSGNPTMAFFLALDALRRQGPSVEATVLTFYDPAIMADGKPVSESAADVRFDCSAKTATELGLSGYDAQEAEVLTTPQGRPKAIGDSDYYEVGAAVCGGLSQLPSYVVPTRAAAARMGKDLRESLRRQQQQAAAAPKP